MPTAAAKSSSSSSTPPSAVQTIAQAVAGPNLAGLVHEPSDLSGDAKALLSKYQTYADAASTFIGAKQSDMFSSAGFCFQESPCFSVDRVSVAEISSASGQSIPSVGVTQISALLDSILAQPSTTFDDSNHDTVFSGLKSTVNGVTLEIIAPKSTVPSAFVAGMVFDTYKASVNSATNAVRAVQAQQDGAAPPSIAICLYPATADVTGSQNFCLGKELDGSAVNTAVAQRALAARFSLEGLWDGFCHTIDIPILCA
jgi:hypothetical protein